MAAAATSSLVSRSLIQSQDLTSVLNPPVAKEISIQIPPNKPGGVARIFALRYPPYIEKPDSVIHFGTVTYITFQQKSSVREAVFKICKFIYSKEPSEETPPIPIKNYSYWRKHLARKESDILKIAANAQARNIVEYLGSCWLSETEFCLAMNRLPTTLRYQICDLKVQFTLADVHLFATGLLQGLEDLKKVQVVHLDIKPANVCFDGKRTTIFDLEGSALNGQEDGRLASTIKYTSPEYILGPVPDFPTDMWCVGTTLYEMYTRRHLFLTTPRDLPQELIQKEQNLTRLQKELELMYSMVQLNGSPPLSFSNARKAHMFFVLRENKLQLVAKSYQDEFYFYFTWEEVESMLLEAAKIKNDSPEEVAKFLKLLKQLLVWEPKARLTPEMALKSEFLTTPLFHRSDEKKASTTKEESKHFEKQKQVNKSGGTA